MLFDLIKFMWKIVKNEIKYIFSFSNAAQYIIGSYILLTLAIALLDVLRYSNDLDEIILQYYQIGILVFYPILIIYLVIDESARKRIRLHASKPVPVYAIGLARILYPLLVYLILVLVYLMLWTVDNLYDVLSIGYQIIFEQFQYYDAVICVIWFYLWFTFAIWSFLEKTSRVVSVCFLTTLFLSTFSNNLFNVYVQKDLQQILRLTVDPFYACVIVLILTSLIYLSFIRRKSFLK